MYAVTLEGCFNTHGNKYKKWMRSDLLPDKSSPKCLARVLHGAAVQHAAVEDARRVPAGVGGGGCPGDEKSSETQEIKPFSSIPGPKPLPLVGNKFFFTAIGKFEFPERKNKKNN